MTHIREVRPHACELKFVVSPEVGAKIRHWARTRLGADANGHGPFGDEYRTTSIYFDTSAFDVFHRRGSFGRSKYRIRRYGDDASVFLERKMRQPAVLAKRRTSLPLTALARLADPQVGDEWPGYWFHRRVAARQLQPVCQVAYSRMARGIIQNGEHIRLTLDSDLRALPAIGIGFSLDSGVPEVPAMPGREILELKYRGPAPALFRQLVEEFALTPRTTSKYRLGVAAIGHAMAPQPPAAARVRAEPFYA